MSNYRSIIMFVIALLAAIGAVFMASKWLHQRSTQVNQVAVATQEINMGQKLTGNMFKLVNWPASSMPAQAFSDISKLEGRVVKSTLEIGEPVLASKLAPEGSQGGLSAVIAEGKRAITVRVNDVVGVAGFALPGNFVDMIVNTHKEAESDKAGMGNNDDKKISKIVLEHILVLAVAQEVGRDATTPKVVNAVTLEVTPEQAEKIDLARSIGELSLVLRNQADTQDLKTVGITKNALLDIEAPAPAPIIRVAQAAHKVIYKTKKSVAAPKITVMRKQCTKVITGLSDSLECF